MLRQLRLLVHALLDTARRAHVRAATNPPTALGSPTRRLTMTVHASNRRCAHVDHDGVRCITRLCYLNPGPDCYVHAEARRDRARRPSPFEVERIMRQDGERERISA